MLAGKLKKLNFFMNLKKLLIIKFQRFLGVRKPGSVWEADKMRFPWENLLILLVLSPLVSCKSGQKSVIVSLDSKWPQTSILLEAG